MRDQDIPIAFKELKNVALKVLARRWQEIARPGVMAARGEGIPNGAAEFAGDQDAKRIT